MARLRPSPAGCGLVTWCASPVNPYPGTRRRSSRRALGLGQGLEDHKARAFAEADADTFAEGRYGLRRHGAQRVEACVGKNRERIAATYDDVVGAPGPHPLIGECQRSPARCARRRYGATWSVQVQRASDCISLHIDGCIGKGEHVDVERINFSLRWIALATCADTRNESRAFRLEHFLGQSGVFRCAPCCQYSELSGCGPARSHLPL